MLNKTFLGDQNATINKIEWIVNCTKPHPSKKNYPNPMWTFGVILQTDKQTALAEVITASVPRRKGQTDSEVNW